MTQTELTQYVADNNLSSKSLALANYPQYSLASRSPVSQTLDLKVYEKEKHAEPRNDLYEQRHVRESNRSDQTPSFHRQSRLASENYPEYDTIERDYVRQEKSVLASKVYNDSFEHEHQVQQNIELIGDEDEGLAGQENPESQEKKNASKSHYQDSQGELHSVSTLTGKSSNAKGGKQETNKTPHSKEFFIPTKFENSPLPESVVRNSRKQSGEQLRASSKSKKYSGERNLSKDQLKERILERMKESREGPRAKVSNKQLHKIYH